LDRPEWKFLRSLSDDCAPEIVLEPGESPFQCSEFLIDEYLKEIYESPFIDLVRQSKIPVPNTFSLSDKRTKAVFKDVVYQSLVLRRFVDFKKDDREIALHYIQDKSYILLVIEDPGCNLRGLSIVSKCLNFHLSLLKETFFKREYHIVEDLIYSWDNLNFFKPNRMNKVWKEFFNNQINRFKLRQFFFKVFEALYLEKDEEFQFHFDMTRYEFFTCLDTFNLLLSQSEHPEDLTQFMDSIPFTKESIGINQWDQALWVSDYNHVNSQL